MTVALALSPIDDLNDAYRAHTQLMPVAAQYRCALAGAAEAFLTDHPDLDAWMCQSVEARLAELSRRPNAWPVIVLAMLSGRCRADLDFLIAKRFGHSAGRTVAILYPDDVRRLREAARRLGRSDAAFKELLGRTIPLVIAAFGVPLHEVSPEQLEELFTFVTGTQRLTEPMRRSTRGRLFSLRQLLFEAEMLDTPPPHRRAGGPATRAERMKAVGAPALRRSLLAYIEARSAVLRPKTVDKLTSALAIFGEFLTERFPEVISLRKLERRHVEAYLTWSATRACRGSHDNTKTVGPFVPAHAAITLRNFLDDVSAWGWAEAPRRRLVFATDIPRQPEMLPRALPSDVDRALMAAVKELSDPFARIAITILRHTGLRRGELLDLELDCLMDFGPSGTWLRVPLGKLNDERAVPLDDVALEAFAEWLAHRSAQRSLPGPRDGRSCDLIFVERGRRIGPGRIQQGLRDAVEASGLVGPEGHPLRVVAHQLRHTWATELANAGMSLQALMTLLGHRSPEMTIRQNVSQRRPFAPHTTPPRGRWRNGSLSRRLGSRRFPTASAGWRRRCSRLASPTAIAPVSSLRRHAPMPTSARPVRTSSRPRTSCQLSRTNSVTFESFVTTRIAGGGSERQPATNESSRALRAISDGSLTDDQLTTGLAPAPRAG